MQVIGLVLLAVAGVIWLGGTQWVLASHRRRLGHTRYVFGLLPLRLCELSSREKLQLSLLLLAFVIIGLLGLAALQGALG